MDGNVAVINAIGGQTMLKPVGLINGHYECRSLDETLPIFTDLLALEVVERKEKEAVLKHPNTEWRLIVHEGGPNAANKPHTNHYGFRVGNSKEIPKAYEYLSDHKAQYKIKSVTKPHEAHFAYSVYFKEPGGNDLEIEYYNPAAIKHGRSIAAPHWKEPLSEEQFPGRGYIPQAMTHGTLNCDDKATNDRFLEEVLGLKIVGGGRMSTYIKHPGHALVYRRVADDAPRLFVGGESFHAESSNPRGSRGRAQRVFDQRQANRDQRIMGSGRGERAGVFYLQRCQ